MAKRKRSEAQGSSQQETLQTRIAKTPEKGKSVSLSKSTRRSPRTPQAIRELKNLAKRKRNIISKRSPESEGKPKKCRKCRKKTRDQECSYSLCRKCCLKYHGIAAAEQCPYHINLESKEFEELKQQVLQNLEEENQEIKLKKIPNGKFDETTLENYGETATIFCLRDFFQIKKFSKEALNPNSRRNRNCKKRNLAKDYLDVKRRAFANVLQKLGVEA